jgi:hypothetical protein
MPLAERNYMKDKHQAILRSQQRTTTLHSILALLAAALFTFLVFRFLH